MKKEFTLTGNPTTAVGIAFPDYELKTQEEILELYIKIRDEHESIYDRKNDFRRIIILEHKNQYYIVSVIGDEEFNEIIFFKLEEEYLQESVDSAEKQFEKDERDYSFSREVFLMDEIDFSRIKDLGIKGFEILFQRKIEEALERNNLKGSWWKYIDNQIFTDVWGIYSAAKEEVDIVKNLQDYYDELRTKLHLAIRSHARKTNIEESITFLEEELEYLERSMTNNNEDDAFQYIDEQLKIKNYNLARLYLRTTSSEISLTEAIQETIDYIQKITKGGKNND